MANASLSIVVGAPRDFDYKSAKKSYVVDVTVKITTNASGSGKASGRFLLKVGSETIVDGPLNQTLSPNKTYTISDGSCLVESTSFVTITASYATGLTGIGTLSASAQTEYPAFLSPSNFNFASNTSSDPSYVSSLNWGEYWYIAATSGLYIDDGHTNSLFRISALDNRDGKYKVYATNISGEKLSPGNGGPYAIEGYKTKQSFANYCPTSPMRLTFKLETFDKRLGATASSANYVGETTRTMTVNILSQDADFNPVIQSISFSDQNTTVASHFQVFVQSKSKIQTHIYASNPYSTSITSGTLSINGEKLSITNTAAGGSGQILKCQKVLGSSSSVTATVKNSVNRTGTRSETLPIVSYHRPSISSFKAYRSNQNGVAQQNGEYITAEYNISISSINSLNDKHIVISYSEVNSSSQTILVDRTNTYTLNSTSTFPADPDLSYNVNISVTDYFENVTSFRNVPSAFVLLDFYGIGTNTLNTGLAIGKVAETANVLDVNMVGEFRKGIRSLNGWINLRDDQGTGYETVFFRNQNYDGCYIRAYNVDENGSIMLIRPGATLVAGGGEYATNRYYAAKTQPNPPTEDALASEGAYIGADSAVYIESGANATYTAGRNTWVFGSAGTLTTPGDISMPSNSSISGVSSVGGYSLANFVRAYNSNIVNNAYVGASVDQTASNASRLVIRVSTTQSGVDRDYALLVRDGYIGLYDYKNEAYEAFYYPNTMYYQAQASANSTSLTAGTPTKITMTSNISGGLTSTHFAIASGGVKVLTDGRYRVTGSVYINSASGQTSKSVYIYAGSSTTMSSNPIVNEVLYAGASSGAVSIAPKIIDLSANDIVFLAARSNGANSTASKHDATYLLIEKIS